MGIAIEDLSHRPNDIEQRWNGGEEEHTCNWVTWLK